MKRKSEWARARERLRNPGANVIPLGVVSAAKLTCETCRRECDMTIRTTDGKPGESIVPVALHGCLQCGQWQDFTVRKPDGTQHRVRSPRPS